MIRLIKVAQDVAVKTGTSAVINLKAVLATRRVKTGSQRRYRRRSRPRRLGQRSARFLSGRLRRRSSASVEFAAFPARKRRRLVIRPRPSCQAFAIAVETACIYRPANDS